MGGACLHRRAEAQIAAYDAGCAQSPSSRRGARGRCRHSGRPRRGDHRAHGGQAVLHEPLTPPLGDLPVPGRQRSWWLREALAAEGDPSPAATLASDTDADVAVVGGGYTGMWAAYFIGERRPDARIVLVEQDLRRRRPVATAVRPRCGRASVSDERSAKPPPSTSRERREVVDGTVMVPSTSILAFLQARLLRVNASPTTARRDEAVMASARGAGDHPSESIGVRPRVGASRFVEGVMPSAASSAGAPGSRLRRVAGERGVRIFEITRVAKLRPMATEVARAAERSPPTRPSWPSTPGEAAGRGSAAGSWPGAATWSSPSRSPTGSPSSAGPAARSSATRGSRSATSGRRATGGLRSVAASARPATGAEWAPPSPMTAARLNAWSPTSAISCRCSTTSASRTLCWTSTSPFPFPEIARATAVASTSPRVRGTARAITARGTHPRRARTGADDPIAKRPIGGRPSRCCRPRRFATSVRGWSRGAHPPVDGSDSGRVCLVLRFVAQLPKRSLRIGQREKSLTADAIDLDRTIAAPGSWRVGVTE